MSQKGILDSSGFSADGGGGGSWWVGGGDLNTSSVTKPHSDTLPRKVSRGWI